MYWCLGLRVVFKFQQISDGCFENFENARVKNDKYTKLQGFVFYNFPKKIVWSTYLILIFTNK